MRTYIIISNIGTFELEDVQASTELIEEAVVFFKEKEYYVDKIFLELKQPGTKSLDIIKHVMLEEAG